jgi:3-deoxy-D-manno-octulosonate 8-phosphate phosphatase (KDO 8-P phosphatase)
MKDIALSERLKHIKLLLLDVDGVMTDGGIIYGADGSEIKIFNVKDGFGLNLVIKAGITVGIVTGRKSKALYHRCKDLGIQLIFDGVRDKAELLPKIVDQMGIAPDHIAFMGDDIPDLALMRQVGLSITVADAPKIVRETSDWTTSTAGGQGAVREVCEALLEAKGIWEKLMDNF